MSTYQPTPLETALLENMLPQIETFPCPFSPDDRDSGLVRIVFPEFTCVCPKTGYPDFASIHLAYLPNELCVELKSWKLYLNAFRMIGTFHETLTAHLFSTLRTLLNPRWMVVVGDFFPRGNVDTTVYFETSGPRPQGATELIGTLLPHCRSMS